MALRKVVRVVEGAALEMLCRSNPTVGSNPTSSVCVKGTKMTKTTLNIVALAILAVLFVVVIAMNVGGDPWTPQRFAKEEVWDCFKGGANG